MVQVKLFVSLLILVALKSHTIQTVMVQQLTLIMVQLTLMSSTGMVNYMMLRLVRWLPLQMAITLTASSQLCITMAHKKFKLMIPQLSSIPLLLF